jgi:hypothetical protein
MGHERQAIVDQELGALVREFVRRLNDVNIENHHRIEWRTPALRTIGISERRVQVRAEHLEIHRRTEPLQLIAKIAQPLQAIIDIEKPRMISHGTISAPSVTRESDITQIDELSEVPSDTRGPNRHS